MKKIALIVAPDERPGKKNRLGSWEKLRYGWLSLRLRASNFQPDSVYMPTGIRSKTAANRIMKQMRLGDIPLLPFNQLRRFSKAEILAHPIPFHVQKRFNEVLLLHEEKPSVAAETIFYYDSFSTFFLQFLQEPASWQQQILVMVNSELLRPAIAVIESRDPLELLKAELSKGLPIIYSFDANGQLTKRELGEKTRHFGAPKAPTEIELF